MKPTISTKQPTVSIIIVNLNGQTLLPACLEALSTQTYPAEKTEIIIVDNGSSDNSVVFIREHYPAVKVIEAGKNLGFAGGNNLGAKNANGEFLAFINNDAIADKRWLSMAMEAFQQNDIACVACKLLNADGTAIDYVKTGLNLFGRAFQIDEYLPLGFTKYTESMDTFAPSGGAMVIRRNIFICLGGFDEDYIAYYEDVDLGWRLWLAGYKTRFVPESFVYHQKHQTGTNFADEQRTALSEINAFRTLIKNLDDENLWKILTFTTFSAVKRVLSQTQIQRKTYQFGDPRATDASDELIPRVASAILVAMDAIADELPYLMDKRRQVQLTRKRTDAEIFAKFPFCFYNPVFSWRDFQISQRIMVEAIKLPVEIQPVQGNHLLIITHERIGKKMAGPGIRAWEMARALSSSVNVILATPHPIERTGASFQLAQFHIDDTDSSLKPLIDTADVILAMGPLFSQIDCLQSVGKPVIVDLYDPFELEKLARLTDNNPQKHIPVDIASIHSLAFQGAIGDFFICANERQRDFWLGTLLAAGRVNSQTYAQDVTLRRLIDVVPFGIPAEPPQPASALKGVHPHIALDDTLLLWNGGLWQWFDPFLLLDALAEIVKTQKNVKLFFAAGVHFDKKIVPEMPIYHQTISYARERGLLNTHVFFGDWIPYDDRGAFLLEADAVVSVHRPGIETHFSSRTRVIDCIWAGVPVITTDGDPLSELVEQFGMGKKVPPGDVTALIAAILDIINTPNFHAQTQLAADTLRPKLLWKEVVKPIVQFIERSQFAPDALYAARRAAEERRIANLLAERDNLKIHLTAVQQGRIMRFLNMMDKFLGRESK